MPEQTTQKIERKTNINFGFGISLSEWAASAVIGLGSAIAAAIATVRDRFKDDIRNSELFKVETDKLSKGLSEMEPELNETPKAYRARVLARKQQTADIIEKAISDRYKFDRNFFTNTFERAETFLKNSRRAIVQNAIIGSIIGSAMALSFFNSVAIRDKLNKIDDAVEPPIPEAEMPVKSKPHPKAKYGEKSAEKAKPDHKVTEATSEKKLSDEREHSLAS